MKKFKFIEEKFFLLLMHLATTMIALLLALIVWTIFKTGISHLSWEMISTTPSGGYYLGQKGGILNAIVGSLVLAFLATLFSALISIPLALYLNFFSLRKKLLKNFVRFFFNVFSGVPSIVFGAATFTMMIFLGMRASLFAAVFAVTLLVIPQLVRNLDEIFQLIPSEMIESGFAIGATRLEVMLRLALRQSASGIWSALILTFGRAIGDAAAVIFTAGFSDNPPTSLNSPVATLPLAIFFQLGSPLEKVRGRAYAAALILLIILLLISLFSRLLARVFSRHTIK